MNAKSISVIAIVLSAAFTAARAESPTPDPYLQTLGTRARAEVVAERDAAITRGDIVAMTGEDSGSAHLAQHVPVSLLTRAQVRAEVLAARAEGSIDALFGEDSGSFFFAHHERAGASRQHFARAAR